MQIETTISSSSPEGVVFFENFEVESGGVGTIIRAKSKIFADHINSLDKEKKEVTKSGLWKPFPLLYPVANSNKIRDFLYPSSPLFVEARLPNLVWIFHKDLEKGFEIEVAQPLSLNDLEDYFSESCDLLRSFYVSQIRKVKLSARMKETF